MPEGLINLTEGSGKKAHTWQRTIGANTVEDAAMFLTEPPYPTYTVLASNISVATTGDHVIQLMSGASTYTRVRAITVLQTGLAGAANTVALQVFRLTTAGTGGTAVTPAPMDFGDSAASAAARTLPSPKGTESGGIILQFRIPLVSAQPSGGTERAWEAAPGAKGIVIPTGTANGIALKVGTGVAGATVDVRIEFVETTWA